MNDTYFWLLSTLFWTAVNSFYSMQEMACISCNKLRLDYAISQNKRWAKYLYHLLENPNILFSTTLVGVNVSLMILSESSRELFEAMGYSPNLAPLFTIPYVLIFGELVPMFAARVYPDHSARIGASILYFSSKLLSPLTKIMDLFFNRVSLLLGKKKLEQEVHFLNREELQELIQAHHGTKETPLHQVVGNVFTLKYKDAKQLMKPLDTCFLVASSTTIETLRKKVQPSMTTICVYHKKRHKIIGVVKLAKLLSASDTKRVDDFVEPATFVLDSMGAIDLLVHLNQNTSDEAVVLNAQGIAQGIVILDSVVDQLFLERDLQPVRVQEKYLEKTIRADMSIADFNALYDTEISFDNCKTFAELIEKSLGRHPATGDTVSLDSLEIVVKESSLFKAKSITIKTKAK